jgi:hypothetical protein
MRASVAPAVDGQPFRERLILDARVDHLVPGDLARGHVEANGLALGPRECNGNRIGAEEAFFAAMRNDDGVGVREGDADAVLARGLPRVQADGPAMARVADADDAHAAFARELDGLVHAAHAMHDAQAVLAVHLRRARPARAHHRLSGRLDGAQFHAGEIVREP